MARGADRPPRRLAAAPHAVADAPAIELGAPGRRRARRPGTRRGVLRAPRRPRAHPGLPRRGVDEPRLRAGPAGLVERGPDRRPRRRRDGGPCPHGRPGEVALAARPAPGLGRGLGGVRGAPRRRRARARRARAHRACERVRPRRRGPGRRPGGVRTRLGGAVLRRHRRERAPARHRAQRGARADALGRGARRAADLPTGRDRQRARARALRRRGLPALARLSLPSGPAL